jgi:trehalose 6-phosphate phosphatase
VVEVGFDNVVPVAFDEVVSTIRANRPGTLLALDFDGTLAPIVPDPTTSRPVEGVVAALLDLAGLGMRVAIVTGRDAETVLSLGSFAKIPGLLVEALYGAEQWRAATLTTPDTPEPMLELRKVLPGLLLENHADPAVWIEDKRLSLVVHARLAADPEAALDPLRQPVAALGARLGLEVHPGHGIIEFRLPGYDKGQSLRRLVEQTQAASVLYLGDDLGDIPAFEQITAQRREGRPAWSIAVSTDLESAVVKAADLRLDGPADVGQFLRRLLPTT